MFLMILGFKSIQSVYFQFDGVTRDKKNNFDKFPTFYHGFVFYYFQGGAIQYT